VSSIVCQNSPVMYVNMQLQYVTVYPSVMQFVGVCCCKSLSVRARKSACAPVQIVSQLLADCFVVHICQRTLYTHTEYRQNICKKMNQHTLHTHAYHQVSLRQMLDTQDCYLDLVACTNFVQVIKKHIRTRMHTRTRTHTCSRTRTRTRTRSHTHTRTRTCAASIQNSHARTCARAPVERM